MPPATRWEYRVVSFDGRYTASLNEYGAEGWELVSVVHDAPPPPPAEGGRSLPMPRTFERISDAAAKLAPGEEPPAGPALLWVLRRPLDDGDAGYD